MLFHHVCLQCGSGAEPAHLYCLAWCVSAQQTKRQVSKNKVLMQAANQEHGELNVVTNSP